MTDIKTSPLLKPTKKMIGMKTLSPLFETSKWMIEMKPSPSFRNLEVDD